MRRALGWMAVGLVAFGLFVTVALARIDGVADELARDRVVDEALRCVNSWETREDIRDAAEKAARTGAGVAPRALGQLVTEMGRTDQAEQLERLNEITGQLTEEGVTAARAEIPNPTCDRATAQQVIDNQEGP